MTPDNSPTLCCDTYSLHSRLRDGSINIEGVPSLLRELEISAIAWNDLYISSWDNDYLERLISSAGEANIRTMALIMEGNLATPDEDARAKQIELNVQKLHAAKKLNAPVVRINLGRAEDDEADGTVGVDRCIAAFNQMIPVARDLGIKMTIENHGGPSTKADWILRIINGSDPEWVGSCLDFGNWPAEPTELRYEEITKLAPYAYHTHVKTNGFLPNGEDERVDYKRAFKIMKACSYNRALSIEWEGKEPADPVEGVRMSRDLVRKYWPEAG